MLERLQFYIDGKWVDPVTPRTERRDQSRDRGTVRTYLDGLQGRCRQGGRRRQRRRSRRSRARRKKQRIENHYSGRSWPPAEAVSTRSPKRSTPGDGRADMWLAKAAQAPSAHRPYRLTTVAGARRASEFEKARGKNTRPLWIGWRLRNDHALELATQPDRLQGRSGPRHRLHDGAQAIGSGAAQRTFCLRR